MFLLNNSEKMNSKSFVFGTALGQYPLNAILTDSILKNKVSAFIYNDQTINVNIPQDIETRTFNLSALGTPTQVHVLTVFFEQAIIY